MKLNLRTLYSVGTLLLCSQYVGAMQGAYNTNSSFTEEDRHGDSFDSIDTAKKDGIEQWESRDTERVQETIEGSNNEEDHKENTGESKKLKYLRKAIRENDEAEIYKLIEEIEDIDKERSHEGYTPLILAVSSNNANVVKKLIEKGVDINLTSKLGNTPLMIALLNDRCEIAKLLIEQGADVKKANQDGNTPLMVAVFYGYKDIVKLLFAKGVDINLTNKFGNTPLMIALLNNRYEIAKLLIEQGADVKKANQDGETPLSVAVFHGYKDIVKLLFEKGVDINLTGKLGNTPLMIALQKDHPKIARFLIKQGADVKKANQDGETPLMVAVFYGHANTVELLLKKGASAEFKPLFLKKIRKYEKIVNLLKDRVNWKGLTDEDEDIQTEKPFKVNSNDEFLDDSSISARSGLGTSTDSSSTSNRVSDYSTSTNQSNNESLDSFNKTDQIKLNPKVEPFVPKNQSENTGRMESNFSKGKQPVYDQNEEKVSGSEGKNNGKNQIDNRNNYNDSRGLKGKRSFYNERRGRGRGRGRGKWS